MKTLTNSRSLLSALVVSDEIISIVENIKYLGVIADKNLGWDEQGSAVTSNISRGVGMPRFSKK